MKDYKLRTIEDDVEVYARLMKNKTPDQVREYFLERRGEAQQRLLKDMPKMYRQADLQALGYQGDELWDKTKDLFKKPDDDVKGLLVTGPTGSGKTYALYSVWKELMKIDPSSCVLFKNYAELFQDIRQEFINDAFREEGSTWDLLTNGEDNGGLVVIDDLGTSKFSDFEIEKLYLILDKRITNYYPIIIAANVDDGKSLKEMYGDRVGSRLGMFKRIDFPEIDLREALVDVAEDVA